MGSDESHFNVSVGSDGQSRKTLSTNHNLFEEKGEPKRYPTEVFPLTSLTPYRQAKPEILLAKPAHWLSWIMLLEYMVALVIERGAHAHSFPPELFWTREYGRVNSFQ